MLCVCLLELKMSLFVNFFMTKLQYKKNMTECIVCSEILLEI